jgi:hypothetical protein
MKSHFALSHESCRKVASKHLVCSKLNLLLFGILFLPGLNTNVESDETCVMLHNMIIEIEHKSPMNANVDPYVPGSSCGSSS